MSPALILLAAIFAPVVGAAFALALPRPPGLRDVIHIGAALACAIAALLTLSGVAAGEGVRVVLANPLPRVELAFTAEPLGALVAAALAVLGVLHAAYTAGFVRANQEPRPASLMALTALGSASALAAAFSANLFTLFVAYHLVLLIAFMLVSHAGDEEARRGARMFLTILLTASVGLLLPAMVWTYAITSTLEFEPGGVLGGYVDDLTANILLALFVFGIAMTAMPPLHRWLPVSGVANFPALVSIQALCVLPTGAIALLKVVAFVFGAALPQAAVASRLMIVLAGVSMCWAALIALSMQDIRKRLAYSAMAQSLAVVVGALLALPAGLFAATLQVVAYACGGATLLMAAGAAAAVTGRQDVAAYPGLGRVMPWTFAGFAIAAASMIGLPPFAGAWARLWLITASAGAGMIWAAALVAAAAVLTFAHLGPLAANALAGAPPSNPFKRPDGASLLLAAPVVLGAAATLSLLFFADPLAALLSPIWSSSP
jgi:multicomponent Na+:H+ antiporter subunit D